MNGNSRLSRRLLMKGVAAAGGAAAAAQISGGFVKDAYGQAAERNALLVIYLAGGYNAIYASAQSFMGQGSFGVAAGNVFQVVPNSNDYLVDAAFSQLPDTYKRKMTTVLNNTGSSDHGNSSNLAFNMNNQNGALLLASALGGTGAIKAAAIGQRMPPGIRTPVNGVSLQQITDMKATIDALGGGTPDPTMPKRELALKGVEAAGVMSSNFVASAPKSLVTVKEGYAAAIETLKKPVQEFKTADFAAAYGLAANASAINDFKSKVAGAELMIRAGANVAIVTDDFSWDDHGDRQCTNTRNRFNSRVMPPLVAFCNRAADIPGTAVTIAIMGDFSRSLPGCDHASGTAVTILGKYIKPGIGQNQAVGANVQFPAGSPRTQGLWAFLAAATKAPAAAAQAAFGANPHPDRIA